MAKSTVPVFPRCRSSVNFDRRAWADAHGLLCPEPTRTIQSQEADANINNIVRNFGVTGKLPESIRVPQFGDFDSVSDYREAIHAVREAERSFLAMPSALRDELGHDPQRFLEYCADPSNLDNLRKYGLAPPAPTPASGE